MSKFWNFIKNEQNEDEVELRISGEIISDDDAWIYQWFGIAHASPNAFRKELDKYKGKNIKVWIDSYGGDVFAAAGIYNALKNHDGKVTTIIDGKAMSAASVIAMAGEEIQISPVGIMMIHNPWTGAVGEAKDMRHAADVLDEVKSTIINAYQSKTGLSRNKISELMDKETFMSAKKAVKEKFADKVLFDSNLEANSIQDNFTFSRLAIQNSMADSMNKFFEIAKKNELNESKTNDAKQTQLESDANITNIKKGEQPMCKTIEELKNAYPDLVTKIENVAKDEGKKEERQRIQAIEEISNSIDPELIRKAKYEDVIDAKELAFKALQKDSAKGDEYLKNIKDDSEKSGIKDVDALPTEQKTKEQQKEVENNLIDKIVNGANKRRIG